MMRRKLTTFLVLILTFSLMLSQVSFAKANGNSGNNGKQPEFVKLKQLDKFTVIDGKRIRINNKQHEFDTPPVIKEGRTLIPVRAVTEALGCTVYWDPARSLAFVMNPEGTKVLTFKLTDGSIYMQTSVPNPFVYTTFTNFGELIVPSRGTAGIYNNRTYVPLRLIAEEFGLKVFYDDKTGNIDIENAPSLSPAKFTKDTFGTFSDLVITIKPEDYTFVGIDGLALTTQYTVNTTDSTVTLLKSYFESITAAETKLKFRFTKGSETELVEFVIKLNYLHDSPSLSKNAVSFDYYDVTKADSVAFTLKDFELVKIYDVIAPTVSLIEGPANVNTSAYTLATDKKSIVFTPTYLGSLAVGAHTLKFEFKQGDRVITLTYTITVREDQPTVVPVINEVTEGYSVYVDQPLVFDIAYMGYTLNAVKQQATATDFSDAILLSSATGEGITPDYVLSTTDVTLATGKITLTKAYLDDLKVSEVKVYTVRFEFKKGDHIINVDRKIQVPAVVVAE